MSKADEVKKYLCAGVSQETTAKAVGCDPAYVSQLMSDPEFAREVVETQTMRGIRQVELDTSKDTIEDLLLRRLHHAVVHDHIRDPMKIARVLQTVGSLPRRSSEIPQAPARLPTAPIALPQVLIQQYNITVDNSNRVVQIGEDSFLPATAQQLERLSNAKRITSSEETSSI